MQGDTEYVNARFRRPAADAVYTHQSPPRGPSTVEVAPIVNDVQVQSDALLALQLQREEQQTQVHGKWGGVADGQRGCCTRECVCV